MQDTGCLGLVHWDDPERWYGEGGGSGVQDWERVHPWQIHVDVWQNQYSIVKQNKVKIKIKKKRLLGEISTMSDMQMTPL